MNKENTIKELEKLRDCKNYSRNNAMNTGYREGILDALDLVKNLTIDSVIKSCKDPSVLSGNKHCNICSGDGCGWYK